MNAKADSGLPARCAPGVGADRTQARSFLRLFARLHGGRDFGGLWYQIFNERAPTLFPR